jgi:hypothetical protein
VDPIVLNMRTDHALGSIKEGIERGAICGVTAGAFLFVSISPPWESVHRDYPLFFYLLIGVFSSLMSLFSNIIYSTAGISIRNFSHDVYTRNKELLAL